MRRPPEKIGQRLAFGLILLILVDEEIREGRNWIGLWAGRVRDRYSQIGWNRRSRTGSSVSHGLDAGMHETPCRVLDICIGQLVLISINQFHITYGIRRLLNLAGDTLASFRADSNWPFH